MSIYQDYISETQFKARCKEMADSVAAGNKPKEVKLPPVQIKQIEPKELGYEV